MANGYTVSIGEAIVDFLDVPTQQTATATIYSNAADFSLVSRAAHKFTTGAFGGTSPTLSAALNLQVSADNSTWYDLSSSDNDNTTATVTTASTSQLLELRADQLAQQGALDGRSYRYSRLKAVCTIAGTSPTIPICMATLGKDTRQGPGWYQNASGVATPIQVVSH